MDLKNTKIRGVDKFLVILGAALALGVSGRIGSSAETREAPDEQRHFSAEDARVRRAVPLPPEVLEILSKTEAVKALMEGAKTARDRIRRSWFSVSVVHLAGVDEQDLIVQGTGEMSGANVTTFWIFRHRENGYALVLELTAHNLMVENHRTSGLLDVTARSATGSEVITSYFQFSGNHNRYKETKRTKEIAGFFKPRKRVDQGGVV